MSPRIRNLSLALFSLAALACGGDDNDAANEQPEPAPECPEVADSCPEACQSLTALRFDAVRGCRELTDSIIGCDPPFERTLDGACYRRVHDDSLWLGSSSAFPTPAFERCTTAENQRVREAPACE